MNANRRAPARPEGRGELADLHAPGARARAREGGRFGLTLGWRPRPCAPWCDAERVAVLWPGGGVTWTCLGCLANDRVRWSIA